MCIFNKKISKLIINKINFYFLTFLISALTPTPTPSFGMGRTSSHYQTVAPDPDRWCYKSSADAPCNAAPGQCIMNEDGIKGGFVADTAFVESTTFIAKFARVCDTAHVSDFAQILDEAVVSGDAYVGSRAQILGHAHVFDQAIIYDDAAIFGKAQVYQQARINNFAQVSGRASIFGNSHLGGHVIVFGAAKVSGRAKINGVAQISGTTQIFGNAHVFGNAEVGGNALIGGSSSFSSGRMLRGILNAQPPGPRNPYLDREKDPVRSTRAALMIEFQNCGICQEELKSGDRITRLKCDCRVGYCAPCLEKWVEFKFSCPQCRNEIYDRSLFIYELVDLDH